MFTRNTLCLCSLILNSTHWISYSREPSSNAVTLQVIADIASTPLQRHTTYQLPPKTQKILTIA